MTIWTINLYVLIAALLLTILFRQIRKPKSLVLEILKNFVGSYFVFSGIIKAIDPAGTGIKMEEYFEIFTQYIPFLSGLWHALAEQALNFSMFMIILEIFLGFALILGAIPRITVLLLLLIILFFTILTGFSHLTGKVTDCGCFGDFIKLTPKTSFYKDLILLALILPLVLQWKKISSLFQNAPRYWALFFLTLGASVFAYMNIYYEPIIDFRPYKSSVNIPTCLKLPPNAKPYIYESVFLYENIKTGEKKEFAYDKLMDINFEEWKWDSTMTVMIQKGDDPQCKDFAIIDENRGDLTGTFMIDNEYTFHVIIPDIKKASVEGLKAMDVLLTEAKDNKYKVSVLTGSSIPDVKNILKGYNMDYEVYNTDATPLKTIMRANPGLLILKKGTIIAKYHYHDLPDFKALKENILDPKTDKD